MKIEQGTQLGSYQVATLLGRGGMGEVWHARDTRLGREVAIKLLPSSVVHDKESRLRFEREARLLASLSHPCIAAIHGFEEVRGAPFLVLEYVAGETLASRLKRGGLPTEEALEIGRQIAEALEAAHEKGVIHRDLKPGNVMVRPDGTVKVLDFGLARAMEVESGPVASGADSPTIVHSPTITADYTNPGVVLGTAPYMSPEQARGRLLDKRTDIWSFGVVLFECLTGQMLFPGENATDSMGAIMHRKPDWGLLPPSVPPAAVRLLKRCLAKDRRERLHDIADARIELVEIIRDPQADSSAPAVPVAPRRTWWGPLVVFAAGIAAALGVRALWPDRPPRAEVRRHEFAADLEPRAAAISPDGTKVAFRTNEAVFLRNLNSIEFRELWRPAPDDSISGLQWSPDSDALAVVTTRRVFRISTDTGETMDLGDSGPVHASAWSTDGFIYLHTFFNAAIKRIPARGGPIETILERDGVLHYHGTWPLPDGQGLLAVPHTTDDGTANTIVLIRPDGTERTIFTAAAELGGLQYVNTGHILYAQTDEPKGVWAIPFSLRRLEVQGEPFPVVSTHTDFSASASGDLIYLRRAGFGGDLRQLVWRDRTGAVIERVEPALVEMRTPAISRDERSVAVSAVGLSGGRRESDADIWIIDLQRATATRLAVEEDQQGTPHWSPDGRRIAYSTLGRDLTFKTLVRRADGGGPAEMLADRAINVDFDRDWTEMVYMSGSPLDDMYIARLALQPGAEPVTVQDSEGWDLLPALRPGGGLLAYISRDSGMDDGFEGPAYLRRYPEGEGRWLVSSQTVAEMRWSPDGERLFIVEKIGELYRLAEVSVTLTEDRVEVGTPVVLFDLGAYSQFNPVAPVQFDVSQDGQRFLLVEDVRTPGAEDDEGGIVVVENWYEEFRPEE